MIKGFMDHWVPSQDHVSKFWKQDETVAIRMIDELRSDIDFNHFTFYTKWYTNGIKSKLPYLYNHPESANVKTNNEWGRNMISHLHSKGISVGAMLQFLTYEEHNWEKELSIDEWELRNCALTDGPNRIADFTAPEYQTRMKEIVKELLTEFPGIDYLFLEFEGARSDAVEALYPAWAAGQGKLVEEQYHYSPDAIEHCRRIGLEPSFIWSDEARAMLRYYYEMNLHSIREVLDQINYKGIVGVVIHSYGYETFIYPDILPDKSWWLVPWNYWVCENESPETEEKKAISKELMQKWNQEQFRICHIGDVTIGKEGLDLDVKNEAIRDFYKFSLDLQLDGYLGMGNPVPDTGLKWEGVTDEHVIKVRKLYKELYGAGGK